MCFCLVLLLIILILPLTPASEELGRKIPRSRNEGVSSPPELSCIPEETDGDELESILDDMKNDEKDLTKTDENLRKLLELICKTPSSETEEDKLTQLKKQLKILGTILSLSELLEPSKRECFKRDLECLKQRLEEIELKSIKTRNKDIFKSELERFSMVHVEFLALLRDAFDDHGIAK